MDYCPNCQHVLDEEEKICPTCGLIIKNNTDLISSTQKNSKKDLVFPTRPFYKRPVFWVITTITLIILLTAGGIVGGYYYYNYKATADYKAQVKSIWVDIVSKSKSLDNTIKAVNNQEDLILLSSELSSLENKLADKQSQVVNLKPPKKYIQQNKDLQKAIDSLADYIIQAKIIANKDPLYIEETKLLGLEASSDTAKISTSNFVSETNFISKNLPAGIFDIDSVFKPIIRQVKTEAEKKKSDELKEKEASDKKLAQQAVISFMQARIKKDITEMRKYLTEANAKEFNPDLEYQGDFDPVDFRIIKTESTLQGYTIIGDETDRSWQGNRFRNRWEFQLILESGNWLIDHRKVLTTENKQTTKQTTDQTTQQTTQEPAD